MGIGDLTVEAVGIYTAEFLCDLSPGGHKTWHVLSLQHPLADGRGKPFRHLLIREKQFQKPHAFQTDGIGGCGVDGDTHLPHEQEFPHLAYIRRVDLYEAEAPFVSRVLQAGSHLAVGKNGCMAVALCISVAHTAPGDDRVDILHDERFLSVCTELSDFGHDTPDLIRDLPGGLVLRIELQNLAGNIPSVLIDVRQCHVVIVQVDGYTAVLQGLIAMVVLQEEGDGRDQVQPAIRVTL